MKNNQKTSIDTTQLFRLSYNPEIHKSLQYGPIELNGNDEQVFTINTVNPQKCVLEFEDLECRIDIYPTYL